MTTISSKAKEGNGYVVYIFNVNRHHVNSENRNADDSEKSPDPDESNICLSLLCSNLDAEKETLVRCHLLKTFSTSENLGFHNEGRYVKIKLSEISKDSIGCYYHHLVCHLCESNSSMDENVPRAKKMSFFICLIGNNDEVMNAFCSELSIFCNQLLPYLEPEEHTNLEKRLKDWFFYCIEYVLRCHVNYKNSLAVLFQSALYQRILVECENENSKWDVERFIDGCSLTNLFQADADQSDSGDSQVTFNSESIIHLIVNNHDIKCETTLSYLEYCQQWVDELLACDANDPLKMRNVLEMFRIKTVRGANTMKRLLKKAENDFYSLYKAYQFYKGSGYGDILLYHVQEEAFLNSQHECLQVIGTLADFIESQKQSILKKGICPGSSQDLHLL